MFFLFVRNLNCNHFVADSKYAQLLSRRCQNLRCFEHMSAEFQWTTFVTALRTDENVLPICIWHIQQSMPSLWLGSFGKLTHATNYATYTSHLYDLLLSIMGSWLSGTKFGHFFGHVFGHVFVMLSFLWAVHLICPLEGHQFPTWSSEIAKPQVSKPGFFVNSPLPLPAAKHAGLADCSG